MIKVDGSFSPNTLTVGVARICRSSIGAWKKGFFIKTKATDATLGQFKAICNALQWIVTCDLYNVCIFSDLKVAVDGIVHPPNNQGLVL